METRSPILALFLALACAAESFCTPGTGAPPRRIATVGDLVLHDARRGKDLPVRITHPESGGPFPVIVFSHGAYGSKDAYKPLAEHWAGHGYVVIQPTHEDSVALGQRWGDPKVFRLWRTRPADVSFILDSLGEIEARIPALQGGMDAGRIGVGGHSYGANTAQLVGGARAFLGGRETSFADPRVTAVALLSGQGPGEMLTERSWEHFAKPLLVMTGSKDGPTRTGQPAEWRRKPYELSPPGDKYLVWVEGMDHGFGGIAGLPDGLFRHQANAGHLRCTQMATLAFWNAYLKGDAKAKAWLRDGAARIDGAMAAEIRHK